MKNNYVLSLNCVLSVIGEVCLFAGVQMKYLYYSLTKQSDLNKTVTGKFKQKKRLSYTTSYM